MNSNVYDNPLTRYKKELWELCLSMKVFENIDESKLEKTKDIFENVFSNYQSQVLQQENNGMLKQTLISEINKELAPLKQITRDSIVEKKKNDFESQYEKKQEEFNTMMHKNVPETPNFGDMKEEPPLENIEALIEQQMKEREKVMNINDETNQVVSNNQFTHVEQHSSNIQDSSNIMEKLNILEEKIQIQSNVLTQIVQTLIVILNKLK